jgi:hypothetical protein
VNDSYYPDRNARSGGRWSTPSLMGYLLRLSATERAAAHIAAGWIPKVAAIDAKLNLAAFFEQSMTRAIALRRQALSHLERDDSAFQVRPAWIEPLRELDASAIADRVAEQLTGGLCVFLLARYRELLSCLDPLLDARTISAVRSAIDSLSGAAASADGNGAAESFGIALEKAWADDGGPLAALDLAIWPPLDRVAVPARPAERPRPEPGARGHMRTMSRLEPEDISAELNDNVMAELSAMELLARCSYEHPDLPWTSHMALAAHVADEARHAAIFRRLLAGGGFSEATLPQHAANYEFGYSFPECEPGSKRELIWRLLIMCTVLEALAVDKLPVEIATRDVLGQTDFARALDYVSIDELFHTENGLRLTRQLCEKYCFDPMLERELVHGRFFGRQRNVRAVYLAADRARAEREIAILEGPDPDGIPFESRTEVELRRRASFTDEECEQVDRWGYNARSASPPS